MNRNNFLVHVALAMVLILVAAFAGQLRKWQKEYKSRVRIIPAEEKSRTARTTEEIANHESRAVAVPEVLVKFRSDVTEGTIRELTFNRNDTIEDTIESVQGLRAIDDLDDANVAQT